MTSLSPAVADVKKDFRWVEIAEAARHHPRPLLAQMRCLDERNLTLDGATEFGFNMDDPAGPWGWQGEYLDWLWENQRTISAKARQLGVTWVGCGLGLWYALYRPGSLSLYYSQKGDDAEDLLQRVWYMLRSLPKPLWNDMVVQKPDRAVEPSSEIELRHKDGLVSRLRAMTAAESAGHGKTAAFVLLDEYANLEVAEATMKAVSPVVGNQGRLMIVSTENGVSDLESGEGNHFHWLWANAQESRLATRFLGCRLHPDRTDEWFGTAPEYLMLKPWQRRQQYPETELDMFANVGGAEFFDPEALDFYSEPAVPVTTGAFLEKAPRKATFVTDRKGMVRVFRHAEEGHDYAIGADVATGRGLDYSVAYVVDLSDRHICAEVYGRVGPEEFAEQLYYLAHRYNRALVAVELGGGYGDPVVIALRDGRAGREAYGRLFQPRDLLRRDQKQRVTLGFPMNAHSRPLVLNFLKECVDGRAFEALPLQLLREMRTFVRYNPRKPGAAGPWPRGLEGCHDDCVMAAAVALEMFRQFGSFVHRPRRRGKRSAPAIMAA